MNKKYWLCFILLVLVGYYLSISSSIYNNHAERDLIHQMIHIEQHKIGTDERNHDRTDDLSCFEFEKKNLCLDKDDQETTSNIVPAVPNGFDCIIKIPCIDLEKIVYTGNTREIQLQNYNLITAAADMTYSHGGNYIICGHNSQLYGHSLNRLDEVLVDELVYIYWKDKIHQYRIISKEYEDMMNTSKFCKQTEKRELTIISCAKHIGPDQYIVIRCKSEE